jgi:hypothetical protein
MDTREPFKLGDMTEADLRALIAEQWERIVRAGATGDDMAVAWLTEALWARRTGR